MVLMTYLSSCERKNTLPDFPGEGSSLSAWSPGWRPKTLDQESTSQLQAILCTQAGYDCWI